jgi:hypothetical protein
MSATGIKPSRTPADDAIAVEPSSASCLRSRSRSFALLEVDARDQVRRVRFLEPRDLILA